MCHGMRGAQGDGCGAGNVARLAEQSWSQRMGRVELTSSGTITPTHLFSKYSFCDSAAQSPVLVEDNLKEGAADGLCYVHFKPAVSCARLPRGRLFRMHFGWEAACRLLRRPAMGPQSRPCYVQLKNFRCQPRGLAIMLPSYTGYARTVWRPPSPSNPKLGNGK